MKGVARISFQDGALLLPAKSPYEREVVFEHVSLYARLHGRVRLELDRRQWLVALCDGEAPIFCAQCRQRLETLTYALGARTLCGRCVKKETR